VTADAAYGSDCHFRFALETQGLGYAVAVRSDFAVTTGFRQVRARALLAEIPPAAWQRLSCGPGRKGPRTYDWAIVRMNCPEPRRFARWLVIRRSLADPSAVAFFACGGPPATTLADLVRVAGRRWTVEESFELAKGDCGLDEYEVRSWPGWHRHVTRSLGTLAVVTAIRARTLRTLRTLRTAPRKKGRTADSAQRTGSAETSARHPGRECRHRPALAVVRLATPPSVAGSTLP